MAATMGRPPFHDQKTGVRYDCNNPDHAGWLRKESAWLKDWRPRFFVLKGSNLFFAKVRQTRWITAVGFNGNELAQEGILMRLSALSLFWFTDESVPSRHTRTLKLKYLCESVLG